MAQTLYYLFREARPRQWIKNLTIFAAIFFTGEILNPQLLLTSFVAFLAFCAASSSMYIFNDLRDLEKDRLHPFKKNRPLASGKLNQKLAITAAILASIIALIMAATISTAFFFTIIAFYLLQFSYSMYLKNVILLDILAIAGSFILRVFAGEIATGFHIDIWLFLTVISVSLFLAIGKRRSELTLLSGWSGTVPIKTRATLSRYSEKMLDVYISMFANSAWITYAFYTFLQRPPILRQRIGDLFDQYNLDALQGRKWIMLTIPLVIYGIMRYLQLIYEKNEGESPEKVLLSDKALIITATVLGLMLFTTIYVINK
ncbi:UbiA prenyltransferase family protein [Patescibacteria group bacterium]|nr:UbiA prenyltransferase family protein [Patescibacteria group bacterium]